MELGSYFLVLLEQIEDIIIIGGISVAHIGFRYSSYRYYISILVTDIGHIGFNRLCVFITAVPIIKLFAWGEGDSGVVHKRG